MTTILYQDNALVVAVKKAGVLSQKDDRGRDSLPARLQAELGGEIFPVHRLDRETEGVMVFARHSKAAAILSGDISGGNFQKEYLCVLTSPPEQKEGTLSDLLYYDRQKNKVFPVKRERRGTKSALLSYRVLEEKEGLALVQVWPKTGRTHQIRVQFASRKMPLYGDRKYGGSGHGLALLCHKIGFSHPMTGEQLSFSVPPKDTVPWILFSRNDPE